MSADQKSVQDILATVALRYRGPGGAVAVLKDGEVIGQRVWGWADMNERIPLSAKTQMPICSITKQFICALLLDLERNPTTEMAAKGEVQKQYSDALGEILRPEMLKDSGLTIQKLVDMQSGLRDYWAMTTLWGAKPDDEFLVVRDGPPAMDRTNSFHFKPGTEYSYCNVNFYVIARVIERVTGEPLDKLLKDRILGPAGMETAFLCANTAHHPPPCVGYEGHEINGYYPAVNRMEWAGDAGLVASLDDMIAWEKHLEKKFSDSESWYQTVYQPQTYNDGTPAQYHYGMLHDDIDGVDYLGHGGALRGYRSERRHAPHKHLSVVVMFNHEADTSRAADDIFRGILDKPTVETTPVTASADWAGVFLDQDTKLVITVAQGSREGEILITYAGHREAETIQLTHATNGKSKSMTATIDGDNLRIHRILENRKLYAHRLVKDEYSLKNTLLQGEYECKEVQSTFHCTGETGMLYGSFDGYLGRGPATPMRYLGGDVWDLTCPRGLDAPAPGDWTMVLRRSEDGFVVGFTIGCWLARKLDFVRT